MLPQGLLKLTVPGSRERGGVVVRPLACRAKVPGFKSRQNFRTSPVHPAVKGYPISDSARYCQNASL